MPEEFSIIQSNQFSEDFMILNAETTQMDSNISFLHFYGISEIINLGRPRLEAKVHERKLTRSVNKWPLLPLCLSNSQQRYLNHPLEECSTNCILY